MKITDSNCCIYKLTKTFEYGKHWRKFVGKRNLEKQGVVEGCCIGGGAAGGNLPGLYWCGVLAGDKGGIQQGVEQQIRKKFTTFARK